MKTYTWINEVVNGSGEVQPSTLAPEIGRKLNKYLQLPRKGNGLKTDLALVRDVWENGSHQSREWAYVNGGKLSEKFSFTGSTVPAKFQTELDAFKKQINRL